MRDESPPKDEAAVLTFLERQFGEEANEEGPDMRAAGASFARMADAPLAGLYEIELRALTHSPGFSNRQGTPPDVLHPEITRRAVDLGDFTARLASPEFDEVQRRVAGSRRPEAWVPVRSIAGLCAGVGLLVAAICLFATGLLGLLEGAFLICAGSALAVPALLFLREAAQRGNKTASSYMLHAKHSRNEA